MSEVLEVNWKRLSRKGPCLALTVGRTWVQKRFFFFSGEAAGIPTRKQPTLVGLWPLSPFDRRDFCNIPKYSHISQPQGQVSKRLIAQHNINDDRFAQCNGKTDISSTRGDTYEKPTFMIIYGAAPSFIANISITRGVF